MSKALVACLAACSIAASLPAWAQEPYPSKPIRFVSCCAGFPENLARMLGPQVSELARQPVVIEVKPGANGILGAEYVAKMPGDGYTVFIGTNSTHAANQTLYTKLPYDWLRDFTPLSGLNRGTLLAVVHPSVPANSIAELTALAKKEPGKLTFGWGSSSARAAVELYKLLAEVKITDVPYKTNPQAATDLIGGRLSMVMGDMITLSPHVAAGKLRPLAVSTAMRAASLPEVPTMQEAGVDGYELTFWNAAYLPAGVPPAVLAKINGWFVTALKSETTREFLQRGGSVPFPTTPEELMAFQLAEFEKWKKIVIAAGIKPE